MDKLLQKFHCNTILHSYALQHAKEKGMELNDLNVFFQPQCWDILTDLIGSGKYKTRSEERRVGKEC